LNQKLQKVTRDIERAKTKIAELQALLPELEKQKTELENVEVIKVFRSANVAPDDFTAFIEAYRAQIAGGAPAAVSAAPRAARYPEPLTQQNILEASDDE